MNWLDFFASLVGSLAWPMTMLSLAFLFQRQIARLLSTLTNLKYKDLELDFGRELKKLEQKAKEIEVRPQAEASGTAKRDFVGLLTEAERLAQDYPEPAIGVAWQAVEEELESAVARFGIPTASVARNSAYRDVQLLVRENAIDTATADVLTRMRNLRNAAVHGGHGLMITSDEALEFIALARGVVEKLRAIRGRT